MSHCTECPPGHASKPSSRCLTLLPWHPFLSQSLGPSIPRGRSWTDYVGEKARTLWFLTALSLCNPGVRLAVGFLGIINKEKTFQFCREVVSVRGLFGRSVFGGIRSQAEWSAEGCSNRGASGRRGGLLLLKAAPGKSLPDLSCHQSHLEPFVG